MGQTIGQLLPYAVGIAISPIPIIAVILMLITPKAKSNGTSFLLGWLLGLLVVGGILLVVAGAAGLSSSSEGGGWVRLALGLLLLVAAIRQWRSRPGEGQEPTVPSWMRALDRFTPVRSLLVAFLLSGVNPKNLLLNAAAMATIAEADLSGGLDVLLLVVFALLASLTIVAPVAVYLFGGQKAAHVLDGWKAWLIAHDAAVMAVLFVILGVKLLGDGISALLA